ncbi:MAG: hypothetical protein KA988_03145 [Longilinea sp.]|nr:hypothetical protein [Longilinea sp.]
MKKQNSGILNWWVDCTLFAGFLAMFFLEVTGVAVHQWLGLLVGVWALYHLLRHWSWLCAVCKQFFAKASLKALLYTLLDAALLLGFSIILVSGLLISTWLGLSVEQTQPLVTAHVTVSEVTLGLIVLKVLVHGRWVIAMARRVLRPAPTLQAQPAAGGVTRREFLRMTGLVCGSAGLAMLAVTRPWAKLLEEQPEAALAQTLPTEAPVPTQPTALTASAQPTALTASAQPTALTVSAQPTAMPTATAVAPVAACQHCPKGRHCSYPGSCRLYTDANGNGLCDLGECV